MENIHAAHDIGSGRTMSLTAHNIFPVTQACRPDARVAHYARHTCVAVRDPVTCASHTAGGMAMGGNCAGDVQPAVSRHVHVTGRHSDFVLASVIIQKCWRGNNCHQKPSENIVRVMPAARCQCVTRVSRTRVMKFGVSVSGRSVHGSLAVSYIHHCQRSRRSMEGGVEKTTVS